MAAVMSFNVLLILSVDAVFDAGLSLCGMTVSRVEARKQSISLRRSLSHIQADHKL